jgi:cytochrome c oxidase assembly protein subunit 15
MDSAVALAWSHRVLSILAGVLLVILGWRLWRGPADRRAGGGLWLVALALVVAVIAVGALTTWKRLAPWTVTTHLVLAHAFSACVLLLGLRLRESSAPPQLQRGRIATRIWVCVCALLLLFQLIYGGVVASTFAGLVCPEWPTCNGGIWFPSFRGPVGDHIHHRLTAYFLVCALALATFAARHAPCVHRGLRLALAISLIQLGLGVANVLLGIPILISALHSTVAALVTMSLAAAFQEAWRKPADAGAGATEIQAGARTALPAAGEEDRCAPTRSSRE